MNWGYLWAGVGGAVIGALGVLVWVIISFKNVG